MAPEQQGILDNMSTGVLALDGDLRVTAVNAAGEAILETSAARCVGQHASKLILNKQWLKALKQVQENNRPHASRSIALRLPSGHEVLVDAIVSPIIGDTIGPGLLVELMAVDRLLKISRDENMLNAQETTRAVIRGLAHEIKNPLGGVRGAAQLLARELPDDSLAEYTNIIIQETDRLRDLVDELLGPRKQLQLEAQNVHEVLEHVINLLKAEAGNELRINRDYDPSLPEFMYDKDQLIQAVLNISRNALQAAEDLSSCTITLRTRPKRHLTVGAKQYRLGCRIDIIDNGPGIPPSLEHAIFAPMVTGRADGTGLGLSIAQSIVNRHGGVLECESAPGKTRFSILLPMENNHASAS